MKDEALRLALDALKTCQIDGDGWSGPHYDFDSEKVGKAIIAIRQALEQPEPEPVAQCTNSDLWNCKYCQKTETCEALKDPRNFASPPKREPLTDEEVRECSQAMDAEPLAEGWTELIKFARAVEAAHGIKGEA